ncbi:MAG: TonB-dependent receptor [Bacteroidetes bacterium]|nr:TonB-dependent receptor [Bacteroidota bacterium]NOG57499.1 TonB-dependent receptor [Bacteroidota bacterium]
MRKYIQLFLALLICYASADAQVNTGILKGNVVDESTGEPLIGATVVIVGTYKATSSDFVGDYEIEGIKHGDYSVKFTYIGYADKIFNGISIKKGETLKLDVKLKPSAQALGTVEIVGKKNLVNLESAKSEVTISQKEIAEMNVRDVQELAAMQSGINKTPDGLQIRGARVYETQYMVDGISAQDPLAGTGFGVNVSSSSIGKLDIITGGAGAEFGDGSSGVISTTIREGGDKLEFSGSWQRDNLGFNKNGNSSWNTDIVELSAGGPVPKTKKKLSFFANVTTRLTDTYFGEEADQLSSSLMENNPEIWAPRQDNNFTNTLKLSYNLKKGSKLTLTNQHSLSINQNTRTLQIVGFDALLQPGYQFERSLNLDNASTYTHQSNLTALNYKKILNERTWFNVSVGRLFTNLRADANGRPFREETVDQIYDEASIVTDPVSIYNPGDEIRFVLPGPGLVNNGGITPLWHDHFAQEYTFKTQVTRFSESQKSKLTFGFEHKMQHLQWVDVSSPWIGAPIQINDSVTSPAVSVGSSNDIWEVKPFNGGLFVSDEIRYRGIIATVGMRLNYWAPGKFADDAVENPLSPVVDQVRDDYQDKTVGLLGYRMKARLLPKINVSFPVSENNVLYFNYGHSMRLPHPRFVYAGLDPQYQDRSFLSNLGNPDINPEVNISYEVGYKTQITKDIGLTLAAFNNNRFDYIVQRSVIVKDQTGRPVTKRMYINQDYARIMGLEGGVSYRFKDYYRAFVNATYQVARGKSNSARESGLQIEQNGAVELSSEQYLAFDRPWDITLGFVMTTDSSFKIRGRAIPGLRIFLSFNYVSGFRYTPYAQEGVNDVGRPLFVRLDDQYLQEVSKPWYQSDLKISKNAFFYNKKVGVTFSIEVRNLLNIKNSVIINPITGEAYKDGDDVPNEWRDNRYLGPQEGGTPSDNPARYLAPRQILYGVSFKF